MLAPEGRCKTLAAAADGYVRAEAAAAMALQLTGTGAAAEESHWLALLLGSSVNQDGRSSALTAPNGPAQQEVIRQAMAAAAATTASMQFLSSSSRPNVKLLQMHGTGTPLGDPIEAGAAAAVLVPGASGARSSSSSSSFAPLVFASDKSGVGHTEPSAGLQGLLHALVAAR